MKIAVVSEDGVTISQHFGRASLYAVVTVEDGKVVASETRPKAGHHNVGGHHHEEHLSPGQRHGFDSAAQQTHATMAGNITDCQVLIAGGMGWGAHESLKSINIEPIITDIKDIEQAVKLYLEGKLPNLTARLH
jgi:predicted Fe-Mo cluster-binding NifX family protein